MYVSTCMQHDVLLDYEDLNKSQMRIPIYVFIPSNNKWNIKEHIKKKRNKKKQKKKEEKKNNNE